MGLFDRVKQGIQIVVGGVSQGRAIVKGTTYNSGTMRPKQGEEWLHSYNTMPWLRANVAKIAGGVASLEWGLTRTMDGGITTKRWDIQKGNLDYRRKALAAMVEEGSAEPIFDHPFLTLWKNPCPALPGGAARKLAQIYYETVGEVFLVIDRGPRDGWLKGAKGAYGAPLPTALWPVPPTWVRRVPTPDRPSFEIRHNQLQIDNIPMSEVLWLKDPDPVNPYARGTGLFYSLADELDSDENAAKALAYSFYNRNRPDLLITLPGATPQELAAFKNDWISNTQGVQNALKNHFVNVAAEVEQLGFDNREMQVEQLRKFTRDVIRQVPGMPPEILGIQDQSNRSTIEAAEYIFNKHVVEPRAEVWREFLQHTMIPEYDDRAVLDYVSPAQEDKDFSLKVVQRQPEFFRVNEIRKMAGQPALKDEEGGKLFFVNGAFTDNLATAPPPAPPGATPTQPAGPGGGLTHPGFEGGVNVPGSSVIHVSVPGAAGSPESGMSAAPHPTAAQAAPTVPALPPAAPKGVAAAAARSFRPIDREVSPDTALLIGRYTKLGGKSFDTELVMNELPFPVTTEVSAEWLRRGIAWLNGREVKGWDGMLGEWTESTEAAIWDLIKGWEDQPRDDAGRWSQTDGFSSRVDGDGASPGSERAVQLHAVTPSVPSHLEARLHKPDGGFSFNPYTKEEPTTGKMVSIYHQREGGPYEASQITPGLLRGYIAENSDLLKQSNHFFGAWHDPDSGKVYLDVAVRVPTTHEARALAVKHDQLAWFDLDLGHSVRVDEKGALVSVTRAFDPEQPRDDSGRWSAEGGAGGAEVGLEGMPTQVKVDGKTETFGPWKTARDAAREYMKKAGLPYNPPTKYVKVDVERAKRIADAYEKMKDDPTSPEVKAAYEAMAKETLAQYDEILKTGLKVEFNKDGKDPYGNPRNAMLDAIRNNHLFVFPTDEGFGSNASFDASKNPLLAPTKYKDANGKPMLVNDVFRVVHDYFGHFKEGVGFRADGEENAWRSHSAMFSPLARRAMTSETRGQNSWVNFGPHGEANRSASPADTVYADQKVGLLPEWVMTEGAH